MASRKSTVQSIKADIPAAQATHTQAEAVQAYADAQDNLLAAFKLPSGTRLIVSLVTGLVTYGATVYFGAAVLDLVVAAAITLTGLGFISWMVAFLGCMVVGMAAFYVAWKAGSFAMNVSRESLQATASSIKGASMRKVSLVRGWFSRTPKVEPIAA